MPSFQQPAPSGPAPRVFLVSASRKQSERSSNQSTPGFANSAMKSRRWTRLAPRSMTLRSGHRDRRPRLWPSHTAQAVARPYGNTAAHQTSVERHTRRSSRVAALRERRPHYDRTDRPGQRQPRPGAPTTPGVGDGRSDPTHRTTPRDALARDHRRRSHPRARCRA